MELKDLKQNDLVSFTLGDGKKLHKGIFKQTDEFGHPMFILTDMGYENQCFDKTLFNLVDLVSRPAIEDDYDYIKEHLREKELEYIDGKIEMLEQKKEEIQRDYIPTLYDVLNYTEEEYY
jgi:hypothetical protein